VSVIISRVEFSHTLGQKPTLRARGKVAKSLLNPTCLVASFVQIYKMTQISADLPTEA